MESVIAKLQKLLAHEHSARSIGNVHEAEAFAAKIAELLFVHKLEMSEVEIAAEEKNEPVAQESVDGFTTPWAGVVAVGVAASSFCRVLKSSKGYIFIGRTSDRSTAISMYRHLIVLGKQLADAAQVAYMRSDTYSYASSFRPGIARTWRVSFLRGYANAIHGRLASTIKTLAAQAQSAGTSLVYVDKSKAAIDSYVTQTFGRVSKGRSSKSSVHGEAYRAGQQAGSSANLKGQATLHS